MNEKAVYANNNFSVPEVTDNRSQLIRFCMIVGLAGPALCWLSVLLGATLEDYPHDKVAVMAVLLSIYAPLLVFLNNKGEKRSLYKQLVQFAWLWFFANTGYQLAWELPWFLLKDTLMSGTITDADIWFWPWWSYGVADTRYLQFHDLTLSISAMDGSVALLEVFTIYLFFKGYRIHAAWLALILGACMSWGQFFFYIGEIYGQFSNIEDGWFGLWIKYGVMNIPWCIFPFFSSAGFIWFLAIAYKKRGVEEYLEKRELTFEESFMKDSEMHMTVNDDCERTEPPVNDMQIRRWTKIMLCTPFIFLLLDIIYWYS